MLKKSNGDYNYALMVVAVIVVLFFAKSAVSRTSIPQLPTRSESPVYDGEVYFAGGCFWGVEKYFKLMKGVANVTVGYANGKTENPTYEQVCSGNTGHTEAVHIQYDSKIISLKTLTEQLFKIIDPTAINKQGNDVGSQYRSGIYYTDEKDIPIIKNVIDEIQKGYNKPIATEFESLKNYYLAEEYHQDYLTKNPGGYCHVNFDTLDSVEYETPQSEDVVIPEVSPRPDEDGKYTRPGAEEIKKMLTAEQFDVTQNCGTEPAFTGDTWDNKREGIYVDIVTGEPLFLSNTKYDSGTGWPSFTAPVNSEALVEKSDDGFFMSRTEVRSKIGDSHLGHVFDDGPADKGGLRYCINSASMRFIPVEEMEKEGYKEFIELLK